MDSMVDAPRGAEDSLRDLLSQVGQRATLLAQKEVELAKEEAKSQLWDEVSMLAGFAIAAVCGIVGLALLSVMTVLALAEADAMPAWVAALLMAGLFIAGGAVAALVGWSKRIRRPLETTRKTLEENVRWAKHRFS